MISLPSNIPSKYLFVLLAAERAKQLQQGAVPQVETQKLKPTYRAMDELRAEKIDFVITERRPDAEPEVKSAAAAEASEQETAETAEAAADVPVEEKSEDVQTEAAVETEAPVETEVVVEVEEAVVVKEEKPEEPAE